MKIQRHIGLPEGEMAIIPDTETLIHNIVTSELEQKDKEIDRLNNIINELEKDMNRDDLSYIETQYVLDKLKKLKEGKDKDD